MKNWPTARIFQPFEMSEVSHKAPEGGQIGGSLHVLLVGFSNRALAQAVVRAGYGVLSIDHFADRDLAELGPALQLRPWRTPRPRTLTQIPSAENPDDRENSDCESSDPENLDEGRQALSELTTQLDLLVDQLGIVSGIQCTGATPVLLAGGTENWPELVDELGARFQVLGPSREQLRILRDPLFCQDAAHQAGLHFPPTLRDRQPRESEFSNGWLLKSTQGSGGLKVRRMITGTRPQDPESIEPSWYVQEEISGRTIGVSAMAGPKLGSGHVVGATESFSNSDWPGPSEFCYRGSYGPIELEAAQLQLVEKLVNIIQQETGLRGWLHFDFVEDDSHVLWLLEINPRWAAGMELLDQAGLRLVDRHLAAWGFHSHTEQAFTEQAFTEQAMRQRVGQSSNSQRLCFAKAVLYAHQAVELSEDHLKQINALPPSQLGDVPATTQTIEQGHPILTLRSDSIAARSSEACKSRLLKGLDDIRRRVERIIFS